LRGKWCRGGVNLEPKLWTSCATLAFAASFTSTYYDGFFFYFSSFIVIILSICFNLLLRLVVVIIAVSRGVVDFQSTGSFVDQSCVMGISV